jgi:hypothetical protein
MESEHELERDQIAPPAPRPCDSDPYRIDAPSGVWDATEYAKLASSNAATPDQPAGLFLCHLADPNSQRKRICGGWAGCHDGNNLLALRVAVLRGRISSETVVRVRNGVSPVPTFATGQEAAAHGLRELAEPGDDARRAIAKVVRARSDITTSGPVTDAGCGRGASEEPGAWFACPTSGTALCWADQAHGEVLVCAARSAWLSASQCRSGLHSRTANAGESTNQSTRRGGRGRCSTAGLSLADACDRSAPLVATYPRATAPGVPERVALPGADYRYPTGRGSWSTTWTAWTVTPRCTNTAFAHRGASCPHLITESPALCAAFVRRSDLSGDGRPLAPDGFWARQRWTMAPSSNGHGAGGVCPAGSH